MTHLAQILLLAESGLNWTIQHMARKIMSSMFSSFFMFFHSASFLKRQPLLAEQLRNGPRLPSTGFRAKFRHHGAKQRPQRVWREHSGWQGRDVMWSMMIFKDFRTQHKFFLHSHVDAIFTNFHFSFSAFCIIKGSYALTVTSAST